ncbi:hypothetical protein ACFLYV_00870 [Chloroflexota bacterium]
MTEYRQYLPLLGLFLLGIVFALLLSTPSNIFTSRIYFSTELKINPATALLAREIVNIGNQEEISAIPDKIGDLQSIDFDSSAIKENLRANTMLVREYYTEELTNSVFLLVVQSNSKSSIHAPPICYRAWGYEIEKEGIEKIKLSNPDWLMTLPTDVDSLPLWARESMIESSLSGTIPVNSMVVVKRKSGSIVERRIVLYFYLIDTSSVNEQFNMVRVSTLSSISDRYSSSMENAKNLMAQVVPLIFEPANKSNEDMLIERLAAMGIVGFCIISVLIAGPLSMITYPKLIAMRKKRTNGNDVETDEV